MANDLPRTTETGRCIFWNSVGASLEPSGVYRRSPFQVARFVAEVVEPIRARYRAQLSRNLYISRVYLKHCGRLKCIVLSATMMCMT